MLPHMEESGALTNGLLPVSLIAENIQEAEPLAMKTDVICL